MLDRPELGQLVLEECLPDLLNTACTRDATLMKELQRECEEIDPNFCHLWNCADLELSEQEQVSTKFIHHKASIIQARRIDEIRKNFNALLNSLEPSFLWTFFERLFAEYGLIRTYKTISFPELTNWNMQTGIAWISHCKNARKRIH